MFFPRDKHALFHSLILFLKWNFNEETVVPSVLSQIFIHFCGCTIILIYFCIYTNIYFYKSSTPLYMPTSRYLYLEIPCKLSVLISLSPPVRACMHTHTLIHTHTNSHAPLNFVRVCGELPQLFNS